MAQIQIPNVRKGNSVTMHVTLTDTGVAVDWDSLSDIRVLAYSVDQRQIAAPLTAEIDGEDATKLNVVYAGSQDQYLGVCKVVVRCTYMGAIKTYDAPAVNFVESTDEATGVIDVEDPEVDVQISVDDISTSLLDEAIAAAFDAAENAEIKAGMAENAAFDAASAGGYANSQGHYAKEQGDYAKEQGDYAKDEGDYAQAKADVALAAASLANQKATLADQKAAIAEEKATLADQKADYADAQGDYANAQGDYAKEQGNYAKTKGDLAEQKAGWADAQGNYAAVQAQYAKDQGDYAKEEIDGAKGDFDSLNERFENTEEAAITIDETTDPADAEYQDEYQRVLRVLYQAIDDSSEIKREATIATEEADEAASNAKTAATLAGYAAEDARQKADLAQAAADAANVAAEQAKGDYNSLDERLEAIEASKQDKIEDLEIIRDGAGKGETAVQPDELKPVAFSGEYSSLSGVPTKLSDFDNDLFAFEDSSDPGSLM